MKAQQEFDPSDHCEVGRVVVKHIDRLIDIYFDRHEMITQLHQPITTFEASEGSRRRWVQVALSINTNPLTFMDEKDCRPGCIDEHTFLALIERISLLGMRTLNLMEVNNFPAVCAKDFTDELEDFTTYLREKLLTYNTP